LVGAGHARDTLGHSRLVGLVRGHGPLLKVGFTLTQGQ